MVLHVFSHSHIMVLNTIHVLRIRVMNIGAQPQQTMIQIKREEIVFWVSDQNFN